MKALRIEHAQLAMPKGEEDKARAFYTGVLGVPEVSKPDDLAKRGGCWFEDGSLKLHLGVEDDFRPAKKVHVAVVVDDLDGLLAKARKAGCEVVAPCTVPGLAAGLCVRPVRQSAGVA